MKTKDYFFENFKNSTPFQLKFNLKYTNFFLKKNFYYIFVKQMCYATLFYKQLRLGDSTESYL